MIYKTNDWCSIIRDLGSKKMLATIGCTLNTENIFALLGNAYLSFAQKIPPSKHHHQFNHLTAIGLGHSAIAIAMHKIASKQFQDTQDFTENQLLARSGGMMANLRDILEKERLV